MRFERLHFRLHLSTHMSVLKSDLVELRPTTVEDLKALAPLYADLRALSLGDWEPGACGMISIE